MAVRFWPALAVEAAAAAATWALCQRQAGVWLAIWLAVRAVTGACADAEAPCARNGGGVFTCSWLGGAVTGRAGTNTGKLGFVAGGTCIGGIARWSKLAGGGGGGLGLVAVAGTVTGLAVLGGAAGGRALFGQAWEGACLQDPRSHA